MYPFWVLLLLLFYNFAFIFFEFNTPSPPLFASMIGIDDVIVVVDWDAFVVVVVVVDVIVVVVVNFLNRYKQFHHYRKLIFC